MVFEGSGYGVHGKIGPAEILLVEDTRRQGTLVSQAVDAKFRHSIFVTLD
jgi:hypothetical protein